MNPFQKNCPIIHIPRIWACSHEVWVIKQDNISSPTIVKLPADHVYDHKKKLQKNAKKFKENNIKGSYIKFYTIISSDSSSN